MPANALVQTRIDPVTKAQAASVLREMGLSVSDAVRLLLVRVAHDKSLPFDIRLPNAETRDAMAELDAGKGARFEDVDTLMADLREDD